MEQFDDMGQPTSDCCRIIGRVINFNPEEGNKLSELNMGLVNLSEDMSAGVYKMKINMSEV